MTETRYREAFDRAKADLAQALDTRAKALEVANKAHQDSIRLRRAATALAAICGENIEESMGLTEAVRMVFQGNKTWRNLNQIKAQIEALGASLFDLKNPDASVMSVLSRLVTGDTLVLGTQKVRGSSGITDVRVWKTAPALEPITDDDIPF